MKLLIKKRWRFLKSGKKTDWVDCGECSTVTDAILKIRQLKNALPKGDNFTEFTVLKVIEFKQCRV